MKNLTRLALVTTLFACGGGSDDGDTDTDIDNIEIEATFSSIHENVFRKRCSAGACHNVSTAAGGLTLSSSVAAYEGLVGKPATIAPSKMRVAPGDPGGSFLLHKLRGELAEGEGDPMPYKNVVLGDGTIAKIEEWIAAGAPNN